MAGGTPSVTRKRDVRRAGRVIGPVYRAYVVRRTGVIRTCPRGEVAGQIWRILGLIAGKSSDQEIADALGIRIRTVTIRVQIVFGKLGEDNRTHAAALSLRFGLCDAVQ